MLVEPEDNKQNIASDTAHPVLCRSSVLYKPCVRLGLWRGSTNQACELRAIPMRKVTVEGPLRHVQCTRGSGVTASNP
jgi:hypothetical protein